MRTLVTLLIDHNDTTDEVVKVIDNAFFTPGCHIANYDLVVDVTDQQADIFVNDLSKALRLLTG